MGDTVEFVGLALLADLAFQKPTDLMIWPVIHSDPMILVGLRVVTLCLQQPGEIIRRQWEERNHHQVDRG